ncbi:MAG: fructose-bisphosphate aldolase class I [Candidatus Velthaea sp.]
MNSTLTEIAKALVAGGKGILAIDESIGTCNKRFEKLGIAQSEEMRRQYRELLIAAPGLDETISGMILFDETLRQRDRRGRPFVEIMQQRGMLPGIKVDSGTVPLTGTRDEKITEGLDGLARRVDEYYKLGARFAKWRAVFSIRPDAPSPRAIAANAHALARYAAICQAGGLVPIVEPELLMDGTHTIANCAAATIGVLHRLFAEIDEQGVALDAMILKSSMVISGDHSAQRSSAADVADNTLRVLTETVPPTVAGIAFLSGGQTDERATENLDAINRDERYRKPWPLTFSFGRALQQPALQRWRGDARMVSAAQELLAHRARMNSLAARGGYRRDLELSSRSPASG